jgi:DNA-binding MarR family transcriptional regulator
MLEITLLEQSEYLDIFASAERLHRKFLDAIQAELDALQYRDINSVRAFMILNIGEVEMTASELLWRGCYLGTNVSYNLKKLTETGYVAQTRSGHDRRVIMVRNTAKGIALYKRLQVMNGRHIDELNNGGNDTSSEDISTWCKTTRTLERICNRAVDQGRMSRAPTGPQDAGNEAPLSLAA